MFHMTKQPNMVIACHCMMHLKWCFFWILCLENLEKVHAPSEHTLRQASWAMEVQFWHVRISEKIAVRKGSTEPPDGTTRITRYEMNLNFLK